MTCKTGSAALLMSVLGVVTGAAASEATSGLAGKRGLSPIITDDQLAQCLQCAALDAVVSQHRKYNWSKVQGE